jgi:hypothetical protein
LWKTDDGSVLLSRNEGEAAMLGRLRMFGGIEFGPIVQIVGIGTLVGGKARQEEDEDDVAVELEQLALRVSPGATSPVLFEAGRLPSPVGAFTARRFSNINPLIGEPDAYGALAYPWGAQVSATVSRFDLRAAMLDKPVVNPRYTPLPGAYMRPHVAAGWSPATGLRIGASYTAGPYLGPDEEALIPAGHSWKDYDQRVIGGEIQFSRGYFEWNGEVALSHYEVANGADPIDGVAYYGEFKYTWTPRFFTALRLEQNDYPFIMPISPDFWVARKANFYDGEIGVGYRLGAGTLVKLGYRRDVWTVDEDIRPFLPDGYSFSTQISQTFDLDGLMRSLH